MTHSNGAETTPASSSDEALEQHTTVPWKLRARLEISVPIPDSKGANAYATQVMGFATRVHPKDYGYDSAMAAAMARLRPLLDLGWKVRAISVTGYDEDQA